jgi:galactokinase
MREAAANLAVPQRDLMVRAFNTHFGQMPALFRAPGRVNLIGEHTDYNEGFVMPAAINYYTWVAAAASTDEVLHVFSQQFQETVHLPLDRLKGPPSGHWSDYVRGMAAVLLAAGVPVRGTNLLIDGQVPLGAGLSSSASLELSVGLALLSVARFELPRLELVKLCQMAEHRYAGTLCGLMDQFIAGFGHAGNAVVLDCRSLNYELVPIATEVRLVLCNSMVKHQLASGEYNARRKECAQAVEVLHSIAPQVCALRDVSEAMLQASSSRLSDVVYRRALHVVTENERVLRAAEAIRAKRLHDFGALMYESHRSLRDNFEVSCAELDLLVELARKQPGVYGARMTGGGFGGCTVNLVAAEAVESFCESMKHDYQQATNLLPDVFVCVPAAGAEAVKAEALG